MKADPSAFADLKEIPAAQALLTARRARASRGASEPSQPALPVLRPARAPRRGLLRRSRRRSRRTSTASRARAWCSTTRTARRRCACRAACRCSPDAIRSSRSAGPTTTTCAPTRRRGCTAPAPPAIGRCSPAACIRWARTSCTATRSAWSAITAPTGAASRATTSACSTRPTTRGARASIARASGQSAYQVKDVETAAARRATTCARSAPRGARGERDPFCLTVGFLLPHPPYVAWREDYERFAGPRAAAGACRAAVAAARVGAVVARESRHRVDIDASAVDARAHRVLRARVSARRADRRGAATASTHEGLDDDTLIVYTTDHGDQLGERGLWWKHTLYEDSVRVPLILRWPGRVPAGERRAQVVDLLDVAATMAGALGGPPLPYSHGRDLLPIARDARAAWHDEVFSEHCTDTVPAWTGGAASQQRMIRSGPWKLIYSHGYAPQLFDLAHDPHERRRPRRRSATRATATSACSRACSTAGTPSGSPRASASAAATRRSSTPGRATSGRPTSSAGSSCPSTTGSSR